MISNGVETLTITVPQAAELLGISSNAAYIGVKRGHIPSVRIGRRILIPRVALERMLDGSRDTIARSDLEGLLRQILSN